MQLIESKTLGSAQASIEFTNIPQDGTDLLILLSIRSNDTTVTFAGGYDPFLFRLNGSDTGYSSRALNGTGSATDCDTDSTRTSSAAGGTWGRFGRWGINTANHTASTFTSAQIYIPNYAGSTNKSISCEYVGENNSTDGAFQSLVAQLWSNTAAITSVAFALGIGSYVTNCSASLYKITKGSDGTTTVA